MTISLHPSRDRDPAESRHRGRGMRSLSRCIGSSPSCGSPILDSMERVKIAGVLYRLVRAQAQKSPRVIAVALIAPDTWGVRADFDDRRRDYRYPSGGPLEELPGGVGPRPPTLPPTPREARTAQPLGRRPRVKTQVRPPGRRSAPPARRVRPPRC